MAAQYWTGERQFPFMSRWKGCIFSTIHFSSVCHAVLIYWLSTVWRMEEIQRFFRGGPRRCREKRHWLVVLSLSPLSLSIIYLILRLCSMKWKNWKGLSSAISGRPTLGTKGWEVCVVALLCDRVRLFMQPTTHPVFMFIYLLHIKKRKKEEKHQSLCAFSPLHALAHLTQQQMAVCHQSVDSSLMFRRKDSHWKATRVQMAVYSTTSHPLGVMKESLSYSRTPSQCVQAQLCPERH